MLNSKFPASLRKGLVVLVVGSLALSACSSDASESSAEVDSNKSAKSTIADQGSINESLDMLEGTPNLSSGYNALPQGGTDIPNGEPYESTFFENYGVNPRVDTEDDVLSTFALDVDTGSYTLARSWLNDGSLPDKDSVRVEEYVNYFDQGYRAPTARPFAIHVDGGPTPFMENDRYQLVRVGIQSRVVADEKRPDAVLTFVIDVSGSMQQELPKVKEALKGLVSELRPDDSVGIVVYGSNSRLVLRNTKVSNTEEILESLDSLQVDGSTNAEEGLRLGYTEASRAFSKDKINRVILLSDGVANVGNTGSDSILETIKKSSKDGIDLVTVGFGLGNYNDVLMEQLANDGNGFYAYVDTAQEAKRLFKNDLTGTLLTVAKDAKVQVEFDKDHVERYRLIGYENRAVADDDFRNDEVDAGEIGAGHTVTALYEVKLNDSLDHSVKYQEEPILGEVKLRWEDPESGKVTETVTEIEFSDLASSYEDTSSYFQLSSTVAAYAEVLRESYFATENDVITIDAVADEADRLADEEFSRNGDVQRIC